VSVPSPYRVVPHTERAFFKDIAGQEMHHLSLAGNILSSIGEDPKLYYKAVIPVYNDRSHLLEDEIRMRLQVADDSNILRFIEVTETRFVSFCS